MKKVISWYAARHDPEPNEELKTCSSLTGNEIMSFWFISKFAWKNSFDFEESDSFHTLDPGG